MPAAMHDSLVRVCAICRREFRGDKADARAAEHWVQHVGQSVNVELEGARIFGTATSTPVIELHEEGAAPKLKTKGEPK